MADKHEKPIFFDMVHSNNACRIRLWLALKSGAGDLIETRMVKYPDLQSEDFIKVNPLKKVPAMIRKDGETVFESFVILEYLEEEYKGLAPSFKPSTPEDRQRMNLMIRCHDIYVASPNCTAPGFSHCQGSMYLSFGWHGAARGMDLPTRAAKVSELGKQLTWLESYMTGPYLAGPALSLADFTWYPTVVFMEFLLPRVFGWANPVDPSASPFPRLAKWFVLCSETPAFASAHNDIWEYWVEMEKQGQFKPIIEELASEAASAFNWKCPVVEASSS